MATLKDRLGSLFGSDDRYVMLIYSGRELLNNEMKAKAVSGKDGIVKALADNIKVGKKTIFPSSALKGAKVVSRDRQADVIQTRNDRLFDDPVHRRPDMNSHLWQYVSEQDIRDALTKVNKEYKENLYSDDLPEAVRPILTDMVGKEEIENDHFPDIEELFKRDAEAVEEFKKADREAASPEERPKAPEHYYRLLGLVNVDGVRPNLDSESSKYDTKSAINDYFFNDESARAENEAFNALKKNHLIVSDFWFSFPEGLIAFPEKALAPGTDTKPVIKYRDNISVFNGEDYDRYNSFQMHSLDNKTAYVFQELTRDEVLHRVENYLSVNRIPMDISEIKAGKVIEGGVAPKPSAACELAVQLGLRDRREKQQKEADAFRHDIGSRLGELYSWHSDPDKHNEIELSGLDENGNEYSDGKIISINIKIEHEKPVPVIDVAKDGHVEHDVPMENLRSHFPAIDSFVKGVEKERYDKFVSETRQKNRDRYYVPVYSTSVEDMDPEKENEYSLVDRIPAREKEYEEKKIPSILDDIALSGTRRGVPGSMIDHPDTKLVLDNGWAAVTKDKDGKVSLYEIFSEDSLLKNIKEIPNIASDYRYIDVPDDLRHIVNKESLTIDPDTGKSELDEIDGNLKVALIDHENYKSGFFKQNRDKEPLKFRQPAELSIGNVTQLEKKRTFGDPYEKYAFLTDDGKEEKSIRYLSPEDKKVLAAAVKKDLEIEHNVSRNVSGLANLLSDDRGIHSLKDVGFLNHALLSDGSMITGIDIKGQGADKLHVRAAGPSLSGNLADGGHEVDLGKLTPADWSTITTVVRDAVSKEEKRLDSVESRLLAHLVGNKSLAFDKPVILDGEKYTGVYDTNLKSGEPLRQFSLQPEDKDKPVYGYFVSGLSSEGKDQLLKYLDSKYKIDNAKDKSVRKDLAGGKEEERTVDLQHVSGKMDNARWHQLPRKLDEVRTFDGQVLSRLAETSLMFNTLAVKDYPVNAKPANGLVIAAWTKINRFPNSAYITREEADAMHLRIYPEEKTLKVVDGEGKDARIRELVNLAQTSYQSTAWQKAHPAEYEKVKALIAENDKDSEKYKETIAGRREKLESVVRGSNWVVPVVTAEGKQREAMMSYDTDRMISAVYSSGSNKVYVLSKEDDKNTSDQRTLDIINALSESALDSQQTQPRQSDVKMAAIMGAVYYGVDLMHSVPRSDMSGVPYHNSDRLYNDPQYAKDVISSSALVSEAVRLRSEEQKDRLSLLHSTSDGIDDDAYVLTSDSGNALDPDGNGIPQIDEDLVGDRRNVEESQEKHDKEKGYGVSHHL